MNKTVVLDWSTVSNGDISENEIFSQGEITFHSLTSPDKIKENIGNSSIILCNKINITEDILDSCPDIKYIGLFATGFNNIDINAAKKRGIPVCNAGS